MLIILLCASLLIRLQYHIVLSVGHNPNPNPEDDIDWSKVENVISIESDKEWKTYHRQLQQAQWKSEGKTARQIRWQEEKELRKQLKETDPEKFNLRNERRKQTQLRAKERYYGKMTPQERASVLERERECAKERALGRKALTGYPTLKNERLNKLKILVEQGIATPAQEAQLRDIREAGKLAQRKSREKKKMERQKKLQP